jgi:hypothetical protein
MKLSQKVGLLTLGVVLVSSVRIYMVWKSRQDAGEVKKAPESKRLTDDQLAIITQYYFATFDQAKQLEGKNVWVKAGFALPYFPYTAGAVQFSKPIGDLPGGEMLAVSKLVKAVAPAKLDDRVEHGTRQYFAVFTITGPEADAKAEQGTFAAPIGFAVGDKETLHTDLLFYYDDPKTIFDHWSQPVWDAIARHTPIVGMTENQARMAAGILLESDSTEQGDRTVTYHAGTKNWKVTFAKGVATSVTAV